MAHSSLPLKRIELLKEHPKKKALVSPDKLKKFYLSIKPTTAITVPLYQLFSLMSNKKEIAKTTFHTKIFGFFKKKKNNLIKR